MEQHVKKPKFSVGDIVYIYLSNTPDSVLDHYSEYIGSTAKVTDVDYNDCSYSLDVDDGKYWWYEDEIELYVEETMCDEDSEFSEDGFLDLLYGGSV